MVDAPGANLNVVGLLNIELDAPDNVVRVGENGRRQRRPDVATPANLVRL